MSTSTAFIIGLLAGGLITYLVLNNMGNEETDVSNKLISNSEAISLIDSFPKAKDESVSGHFTIGEVLGYLDFVNSNVEGKGITVSGIEIFFARYPSGKNTFVLYPTYVDTSGNHMPFDVIESGNNDPITLKSIKTDPTTTAGPNLVALNKSRMSPPRFDTY